jgi:hypothetical protein
MIQAMLHAVAKHAAPAFGPGDHDAVDAIHRHARGSRHPLGRQRLARERAGPRDASDERSPGGNGKFVSANLHDDGPGHDSRDNRHPEFESVRPRKRDRDRSSDFGFNANLGHECRQGKKIRA